MIDAGEAHSSARCACEHHDLSARSASAKAGNTAGPTWSAPCHKRGMYNVLMRAIVFGLIVILLTIRPGPLPASEDRPSSQPGARERLNQVLNSEGGIHVYKNHRGTVESTITLPNGGRIITVQPPHGSGLNLGPPLQLNHQPLQLPPPPPIPAQPPAPEFPQRAR